MMTNLLFNQLTAIGKRFAMVLTMLVMLGVTQAWGAVISGDTYSTASSMPTGWSKNGDYNNSSYLKLVASTNYIQTDAFCVKSFSSIKIKARKFGGPTDAQAKITVEWIVGNNSISLGSITPTNTTLTDYTISSPTSVSANQEGYIKISCKGASSSKGSGVSQVTITYTSGNCSGGGTGGDGDSGDDSGDNNGECTWQLVTNVLDLAVGDEIVIAASTENYALGTTQNNNNRSATAITKNNDNTITIDDKVQIITLCDGLQDYTLGFSVGSAGFLYAASSTANHLKSKTISDNNCDWVIGIDNTGVATIQAQGDNTRNIMRYNPNSGNPIFACYASSSTTGILPAIYKKVCGSTELTHYLLRK